MADKSTVILTGLIGLLAATLVGAGEFMLHFDQLARYGQGFDFFMGVTESRATVGHFLGVLGAPLYVVGAWHIYLMLRPANRVWARLAFFIMAYGCIVGAVWIGSRATAAFLVNSIQEDAFTSAIGLYELRYESLLTVVRVAVLILSGIFVWLVLSGRSNYPRWVAALNPIVLIFACFLIFWLVPEIGKYLMPIALNVAYFILFAASTMIAVYSYRGASQ